MFDRLFHAHPRSVGETYVQHMGSALFFARLLFVAAVAALIHAIFPSLFEKTASQIVKRLHDRMVVNRARTPNVHPTDRHASL